jgi:RNA-directed DNA polymerase
MERQQEDKSVVVLETTKQTEEGRTRWEWAEPKVWTARMLTALEEGIKGGVWFSLIDKVYTGNNLRAAFAKVKSNGGAPGIDHVTTKSFEAKLDENIASLETELKEGTYQPQAIRRVYIPKPGSKDKRPLGIPTVKDRVVQTALRSVIEPIFEKGFAQHSYGFRPGKGCKDGLRELDKLLKDGYTQVVDVDISSYFDNIPHEKLVKLVKEEVADSRIMQLIDSFLNQEIFDNLKLWTPEKGTPQGAVISPLLSNIYLNKLDHKMANLRYEMIRYADDMIVLCRTEQEAQAALKEIQGWMENNGLQLHPTKTRIANAITEPFEFLGYRFESGRRRPRKKSLKKLKDTIKARTKRCNGNKLEDIVKSLNPVLRGWYEYFKHCCKYVFKDLDGWIRMRLRSILRKRSKKKGRGRGSDHQRWPNNYFRERGLISLVAAHARECQSSCR